MNILKPLLVFVFGAFLPLFVLAQQDSIKDKNNSIELDYFSPKEYEIGNIIVTGADHLDHPSIILISGLSVGDKILFRKYAPDEIKIDEEEYLVMTQGDVIAILE
jgi:chaperonin GroES